MDIAQFPSELPANFKPHIADQPCLGWDWPSNLSFTQDIMPINQPLLPPNLAQAFGLPFCNTSLMSHGLQSLSSTACMQQDNQYLPTQAAMTSMQMPSVSNVNSSVLQNPTSSELASRSQQFGMMQQSIPQTQAASMSLQPSLPQYPPMQVSQQPGQQQPVPNSQQQQQQSQQQQQQQALQSPPQQQDPQHQGNQQQPGQHQRLPDKDAPATSQPQQAALLQTLSQYQSMLPQNMPNLPLGNIQGFNSFQGFPAMPNNAQLPNLPALPNLPNLSSLPTMPGPQNQAALLQGHQNLPNMLNLTNVTSMSAPNPTQMQNMPSMPSMSFPPGYSYPQQPVAQPNLPFNLGMPPYQQGYPYHSMMGYPPQMDYNKMQMPQTPALMPQAGPNDSKAADANDDDGEESGGFRAVKRSRLVWTKVLHKRFEDAVNQLGVDRAVPKTIMQIMNVEGLTRENVASHLQKYRLQRKKHRTTTDTRSNNDKAENSCSMGQPESHSEQADGADQNGSGELQSPMQEPSAQH